MTGYIISYLVGLAVAAFLVLRIFRGGGCRDPESQRAFDDEQAQYLRERNNGR